MMRSAIRRYQQQLLICGLVAAVSAMVLALFPDAASAVDLLGGKGSPGASAATAAAQAAAQAAQGQAQSVAKDAMNSLSRAAKAIQDARSAQDAARGIAVTAPTTVTNGLSPGGLVVDPRVVAGDASLWVNAGKPTETTNNGQTTVTIEQQAQRAILTWQQFDVGKNTTVHFDQRAGNASTGNSWIALNRIDATGKPSQILGSIKAEGTVVLINPNGVIFNGTSQINVHSLIAAAMDLNGLSSGSGSPATSVFSNGSGNYVPVIVNGVAQTTSNGTEILAPPTEGTANAAYLAYGLFAAGGNSLILAAGVPGSQNNQGVTVQAGAQITTNVSGFDNGGLVALLGPSVSNSGAITVSSGQIILATDASIYLTQPRNGPSLTVDDQASFTDSHPFSPGLAYNSFAAASRPTSNHGLLLSNDGNISLVGGEVNQLGVAEATTSINRAGTIKIWSDNKLTLGSSSLTAILPDENGKTIPSDAGSLANFVAPSIAINAAKVDFQGNAGGQPGSLVVAPGAKMTVSTNFTATESYQGGPIGRLLIESGSTIDLGGLDATASLHDYLYTFKVTANDVADTPLAKNLIGQTVTIDLRQRGTRADGLAWVGSPLFASSGAGYLASVAQGIDQLLTKGGSVTAGASGYAPFLDVIQVPGSIVNVSGGSIAYSAAHVDTTKLLGADGRVFDIGTADPFIVYRGLAGDTMVNHAHWGVIETYTNHMIAGGYDDPGSTDGVNAGALSITAANPILEGAIRGATYVGSRQTQLPLGGALSIKTVGGALFAGGVTAAAVVLKSDAPDVLGPDFTLDTPLDLPSFTLVTRPGGVTSEAPEIAFSTSILSAAQFGTISISSSSALSMEQGSVLTVQPGGSIKLGGVTTIDGTLQAAGGKISITGFTGGTSAIYNAPPISQVTIGPHAVLTAAGQWINDTGAATSTPQGSAFINGGSVTIQTYTESVLNDFYGPFTDATQSIVLAPGSIIDVSSGGYVGTNGKLKTGADGLPVGAGGDVSLLTYVRNPANGGDAGGNGAAGWISPAGYGWSGNSAPTDSNGPTQANLFLGGKIYAGGLSRGGSLSLQAPTIQLGGVSAVTSYTSGPHAGELLLPASLFASDGFASYNFTSTYGSITVVAGTKVPLQQQNYLLNSLKSLPASGTNVRDFAAIGLLPDGLRHPVNLNLIQSPYEFGGTSDPSTNAGILVDSGAAIVGEPGAAISLTAAGPVTVLGDITAPGGSITLANNGVPAPADRLTSPYTDVEKTSTQAPLDVWIGPSAKLDVSGVFVPNPLLTYAYGPNPAVVGSVLNGGTITVTGGTVVATPGSEFDLAGTSATVPQANPAAALIGAPTIPRQIWSNGGTLTLTSSTTYNPSGTGPGFYQSLYFDGTINAAGGAPQAAGGTLVVGIVSNTGGAYDAIVMSQNGLATGAFNTPALAGGTAPATAEQLAALLPNTASQAFVSADTLNGSGLDSVSLMAKTIAFSGDVTVKTPNTLTLAGNITLLPAGNVDPSFTGASIGGTVVNLDAGYALLVSNKDVPPALSDGTLNVNGSRQIDLAGAISVSNAADVNLTSGGDIRFVSDADPTFRQGVFASTVSSGYSTSYFSNYGNYSIASSLVRSPGLLAVPDNLTLTAREVYPASDTAFMLLSTGLGSGSGKVNTITIASNGQRPVAPLSIDGEILIDAQTIVQGGALYAPLGTIQLGLGAGEQVPANWSGFSSAQPPVATQSLTLAAGSLTSVSAAGLNVPYGTTINNTKWNAINPIVFAAGQGNNPALTAPPTKTIQLSGATINSASGAVVDLSGGGDIYATEFVPGTGGSRNVLTGAASGQKVYALVPGYNAPVAVSDTTYGQIIAPGTSITLAGGNGIAAGTYTLLPAIYATMPGAYRVVVVSNDVNPAAATTVIPDGSVYMTGTLGNAITGAKSSQTALFEIQSNAVWTKYSEIDLTSANSYFPKIAAAGQVTPQLPIDGGVLGIAATSALSLNSTFDFAPAAKARGGAAEITGSNLLVLAPDQTEDAAYASAGYIVLDSDQLSKLGADTLLIGGSLSQTSSGTQISATASSLVVQTDAAHPLTSTNLILVADLASTPISISSSGAAGTYKVVGTGAPGSITVAQGSVIRAAGGGSASSAYLVGENISIGANTVLSGSSLYIDGRNVALDDRAAIAAKNYLLAASAINLGNAPTSASGLTLTQAILKQLAGAQSVALRGGSGINFYGDVELGNASAPINLLTLDSGGLYGNGGNVVVAATSIDLVNSQGGGAGTSLGGGGMLTLNAADAITMDAGAKVLDGFATVNAAAGQQIVFTGAGSLDARGAAVALTAPNVVAVAGSVQSLVTTGHLTLAQGGGSAPALAATNIGGALTLTAGSIYDSGTISALAGKVTLAATSGDIVLNSGARVLATGSHIALFDVTEDAPGGSVSLIANVGNVTIDSGATIDVSATGIGYAGSLRIRTAPTGTATLNGKLSGAAAYNDLGGTFTLDAGALSGALPLGSGFTGGFAVQLAAGDITIPVNTTLTSGQVLLVTDNGSVNVFGTIDASGPTGGTIGLYGSGTGSAAAGTASATGVTIGSTARLLARYQADDPKDPAYGKGESTLVQNGGVITLGTTGTPNGTYNATYGYENVDGSGAITVASGAILDVSGGAGGANISNTGGEIIISAPILTNGNVNVSFKGNVITSANGGPSGTGVALDAYAVWSTTDNSSGGQHFDGIIDPAGWFASDGTPLQGLDQNGFHISAPTPKNPLQSGQLFTPETANSDHVAFYQTTLVGFVQNPFDAAAIAGDFAGASGLNAGSTLHLRPGITLINPSSSHNGGNVTVASNWNLGAGTESSTGVPTLYYRTTNGIDPGEPGTLTLRAVNNVQINATISDGFFQTYRATTLPAIIPGSSIAGGTTLPDAIDAYQTELNSSNYQNYASSLDRSGHFVFRDPFYGTHNDASMFSGYFDLSLVGPERLQAPAVFASGNQNIIDQYNQFYTAYVKLFDVYAAQQAYDQAVGFVNAGDFGFPYLANLPPEVPTAASAENYITPGTGYAWQYAAYLFENSQINSGNPLGLTASSSASLSQLFADLSTIVGTDTGRFGYANIGYAAPFAPYYVGNGGSVQIGSPLFQTGDETSLPALQPEYVSTGSTPIALPPIIFPPKLASPPNSEQIAAAAAAAADAIANNPGLDGVLNPQYNLTTTSNLMPVGFGGSRGSFSYDFVGGANFGSSANPNSVASIPAGAVTTGPDPVASVTVDGHTSYTVARMIVVPTIVRTGTGSITIEAAGSFELLDTVSPGVVYTAGAATTTLPADYKAPVVTQLDSGLVSTPSWAMGGGSVTITAGTDIVGIEAPVDTSGLQTGVAGAPTGEFWSTWYYRAGLASGDATAPFDADFRSAGNSTLPWGGYGLPAQQYSTWINYGTFTQGVGALGGGNVTLKAGRDIFDISASLPETIQVSGGLSASGPGPAAHYYGGGNLVVRAEGSLYSSTFYVGRGTGDIKVGGVVAADSLNPVTGTASTFRDIDYFGNFLGDPQTLPLLLAVQDGFISIRAAGSVSLGGVFDPTQIPQSIQQLGSAYTAIPRPDFGVTFQSYGANSDLALTSLSGDVNLVTLADLNPGNPAGNGQTTLFSWVGDQSLFIPGYGSEVAPAVLDAVSFTGNVNLAAQLQMIASPTGTLTLLAGQSISMAQDVPSRGQELWGGLTMLDATASSGAPASLLGIPTPTVLPDAVHANDPTPAIIYAGADIIGSFNLIKPAKIEAGVDILNTNLVGQNNNPGDITSVIAGRDIIAQQKFVGGVLIDHASNFRLYGPGSLLIEAGRNLGPFFSGQSASGVTGIQSVGDGSNIGSTYIKSYLPVQGANIYALFGVGQGIDYQAAIDGFVNPTSAANGGIEYLSYIASELGETPQEAWATFQSLPANRKQLLIDHAFLRFLSRVGLDYNDPKSPYHGQYARAYKTISTLFPASRGYTDNTPNGTNGAATTVSTGDLSMAHSLLETQNGGDIAVIGPGGNIIVGANATDNSKPSEEGILTLQGGSILTYTDQSVVVYQSRIFTEQGGNIEMFSANGDLNAGKGPKTSASYPPLSLIWDVDGYSRVNPAGLVTGAGIGALLTVPGQDPSLSNVNLVAPHGTVDAGAAGIRVSGDLNIAALQVLNAFNVEVGGTAVGVPTFQTPDVGGLTQASSAGSAAIKDSAAAPAQQANEQPSIIIVEVIGYGGGDGNSEPSPEEKRSKGVH